MKLTVFILHCFLLFIRLEASLLEKSSSMGYISFSAEKVSSNFIPGILNNIFITKIFPYLCPLPPYFAALSYSPGNKYQLINKDWAQITPSISDLFYYYHIVNCQFLYTNLFFDSNKGKNPNKTIHSHINERNFSFIKKFNIDELIEYSKMELLLRERDKKKYLMSLLKLLKKKFIIGLVFNLCYV